MTGVEQRVLPRIYTDSGERLEVQADSEGGQGLGEGLGQQAGSVLENLYAATTPSVVVVV